MKNIKFKKKGKLSVTLISVVCVVVAAAVVAAGFILIKRLGASSNSDKNNSGYSFETRDFESVSDIKCLDEKMAIFTDSESKKKGIMTLGGAVTEEASHDDFYACSDVWRNMRYIAKSPLSEYELLVDLATKTVTSRQYHGLKEPERIPCWEEKVRHLAWTDEKGYAGEVKTGEVGLAQGLYPVADSLGEGAKYGYVNQILRLEISLIYENAMDFSGGLAAVKKDGKWGYINEGGVTVIPFDFEACTDADAMGRDFAFSFINGLAPVCKGGKYGIINKKGETVVDFSFDVILQGENGKYIALRDGRWGLISIEKELIPVETTAAVPTDSNGVAAGGAIASGKYRIKTAGSVLNMRENSYNTASIVAKIPNGTVLNVTKSVPGWAYAKYNSFSGWVSADFLVPVEEATSEAVTATDAE